MVMKFYKVKMIQEYIETYVIEAESEQEAVQCTYQDWLDPSDTKAGDSKVKTVEVINETN